MAGVRRVSDITTVPYNVRVLLFHNKYGAHSVGDIIVEFRKVQNHKETCIEFFNSKVALMTRLHRAGMSASFPESNLRIVMIRGLRKEYSHVVSLICETDDKCSIAQIREILQLHSVRIEKALAMELVKSDHSSAFAASSDSDVASAVHKHAKQMDALEKRLASQKFTGKCYSCGRNGHRAIDCPASRLQELATTPKTTRTTTKLRLFHHLISDRRRLKLNVEDEE